MPKRQKKENGFTLIEVAVSAAILVFLMSIVWSSDLIKASDFGVMIAQEKLRLLVTRAKSLTVNGVFGKESEACGYGVMIEQKRAFLFLDKGTCEGSGIGASNQRYDLGEQLSGSFDSISLTEGIIFLPSSGATAQVVFVPPYSLTVINGNRNVTEIEIEARFPSGTSRRVIINNQGLINPAN